MFYAKTKHIEIDCHFVREKIANKQIKVRYVPTEQQVADLITKPLVVSHFCILREKLMIRESLNQLKSIEGKC